jgi:hypothetical protein
MASTDQKRRLLKAKIAVALQDELGRVPKDEEVNQVFTLNPGNVQSGVGAPLQAPGAEKDRAVGHILVSA